MYSTNVFYYLPRQYVVLFTGNSPRRYDIVYAKNLTLHKGVDNRLQFQFINQEQKPVDISGKEITMRIISYDGTTVLIKKALTITVALTGIAEFQLLASELEDIDAQKGSYSLEIPVGSFDLPVFVNSDSGARGVIEIVDSVLPRHIPSMDVTIPSHPTPASNTVTFYTSVINTSYNPVLSIQSYYTGFSGTMQLQGSTLVDADWYDIGDLYMFLETTGTEIYTLEGFHPYVRMRFDYTEGNVDNILVR